MPSVVRSQLPAMNASSSIETVCASAGPFPTPNATIPAAIAPTALPSLLIIHPPRVRSVCLTPYTEVTTVLAMGPIGGRATRALRGNRHSACPAD
jgi:hypothetical protein